MTKKSKTPNSIEKLNDSVSRNRENLSILKGIDESSFSKIVKGFGSEKESNKIVLSGFLNSTNISLAKLGDIKIDINHIKNHIWNKPDISKDLELKIAKLFVQKLYRSGATNIPFISEMKEAFNIENESEIENKNIDFKAIQVNIEKLSDMWDDKINSVTITNDEIFDLLGSAINKYTNFQSQSISSQPIILDLLNFEVKGVIDYVKSWGKKTEKNMEGLILPMNDISDMFDKISDPKIAQLKQEKEDIQEQLFLRQGEDVAELKRKRNDVNKKIWERYIEIFEKSEKNLVFTTILKKLHSSNFDFSKLDKKEQTILWQGLVVDKFDKQENSFAKHIGLDQDGFKDFLKTLYDFEKDNLSIDIDGIGSLNLKITKKVIGGENKIFMDSEKFKNMDEFQPIEFTVNIDDNDENIIKDLEEIKDSPLRADGIMETHTVKGGELNIGNGYTLEICGKKIKKSQLDELLFCKDLPELDEKLKDFGLFEELKDIVYGTRKELFKPQNVYTNLDEDGFDTGRGNNSSTISYSDKVNIFEEVLKKLDVKVIKRDLVFEGKNINKLSQLYIMSKLGGANKMDHQNKRTKRLLDVDRDSDEFLGGKESGEAKAEALWNDIKNDYLENPSDDDESDYIFEFDGKIEEDAERFWNQLDNEGKEAFKDKLYSLCDSDEDIEDSDRIRDELDNLFYDLENPVSSATGDTENKDEKAPEPEKTPEEQFQEAWEGLSGDKECQMVEGTRLYIDLGESQLEPKDISDATKSYYGFTITNVSETTFTVKAIGGELKSGLIGNEYTLPKTKEQLNMMRKGGGMYKVREGSSRDRNSCLESINKAGFFKKFTAFGNMKGQVKLEGGKFVNEKGEEIKYFDRMEGTFDNNKPEVKDWGQGEKLYKYEIKKIDTHKGTVQIASTFDGHDKETYDDVKYKYENELPFEQFILLMEGKRLKGYTEDEQKEMETKYSINDPKRLASKGLRKWISIGSIINVFKNITKSIKGKIDEKRKEQDEFLENYLLSQEGFNLYGKLRWLFGDNAEKLQYEFYTNRENRTWKKIEERYKIFETDPQYSEFFGDHLLAILKRQGYVGNDKDRYKFAAAFLIMVKKEGPYPRALLSEKDKGKRVENILGPEHKIRFLNFYNKKKNEIEQEKDLGHQSGARLALQEELNKMEIQYIISTIDGRAPYGPASNEYMLKSIWSKTFMQKLEENINGYYNNHKAEKEKLETFYAAEESYLRNIGSGKFQAALPALERMCEKAKTPGEVFRIKGYMLGAMLMGIIKNNSTASTIKSFWGTCRAMGFAPGYWMRDIEQQDKVKALLDGITDGKFSKETNFNISDFEPGHIKDYVFGRKFQGYWNSHGKDILDKIEDPTYKGGSKSIVDLANEKDNPNNYIFKDIIKNSTTNEIDNKNPDVPAIFAQESPLTATSNMIEEYIPSGGKYKPKDPERISDCEDFRKKVNSRLSSGESDRETTEFLFKKYFNRFNTRITSNEQKMIVKSIKCIQKEKNLGHNTEAKFLIWYMFKGTLHNSTNGPFPADFENVTNKFVDFFFNNINLIDKNMIKDTFDNDKQIVDLFDNEYKMINWSKFLEYNMTDTKSIYSSGKNSYNSSLSVYLKNKGISEEDIINKKIAEIWRSIHNKCSVPENINWSTAGDNFKIFTNQELKRLREENSAIFNDYDYGIPA